MSSPTITLRQPRAATIGLKGCSDVSGDLGEIEELWTESKNSNGGRRLVYRRNHGKAAARASRASNPKLVR